MQWKGGEGSGKPHVWVRTTIYEHARVQPHVGLFDTTGVESDGWYLFTSLSLRFLIIKINKFHAIGYTMYVWAPRHVETM